MALMLVTCTINALDNSAHRVAAPDSQIIQQASSLKWLFHGRSLTLIYTDRTKTIKLTASKLRYRGMFQLRHLGEYDALTAIESPTPGVVIRQVGGYHTGTMQHKHLNAEDYDRLVHLIHELAAACDGVQAPFAWQLTLNGAMESTHWTNMPPSQRQTELLADISALTIP